MTSREATILGAVVLAAAALSAARREPEVVRSPFAPGDASFVGSGACRACHPSEHASFTRSFHRTMTQLASPETVRALGAPPDGRTPALFARGDQVFADLPEGPRRIMLTTGSHREQAYWLEDSPAEGSASLFPWVWMVRERRFVPRGDAFVTPPDVPLPKVRWSSSCIACHAVGGEPRRDPVTGAFATRVAEPGIACEACHGAGRRHVDRHRDPVERVKQRGSEAADPTIVHPAKLEASRSLAVCGQCHGYAYPRDEDAFWQRGYVGAFRPGDELGHARIVIDPATLSAQDEVVLETDPGSIFWPDGAGRVGGREHGDVVSSACFFKGQGARQMTCLSCHSMHAGDPAGQLAPDRRNDAACGACHDLARARAHTHHAPDSPGSACVACHMPRTTYALLSATRSHRVAIPTVDPAGRPDACSLCHLDKPLAWTVARMAAFYGRAPASLDVDGDVPEGVRRAATGDAAVRAILADAFARDEVAAAGVPAPLRAGVLAKLARDPYGAVRFVAERGLGKLPAGVEGEVDEPTWRRLLDKRDTRAVTIAE